MRLAKGHKGFTLVEIIIVVLIIAMLLAVAIPNFLRAREISRARTCQTNLREIATAKEQWAMDNRAGATASPNESDLVSEYIKGQPEDVLPNCPAEGTYTIGDLTTRPLCSIGTNVDPGDWDDHNMIQ